MVELSLARINEKLGDLGRAESHYRRSIDDLEQAFGGDPVRPAVRGYMKLLQSQERSPEAMAVCVRWKESGGAASPEQAVDACTQLVTEDATGESGESSPARE